MNLLPYLAAVVVAGGAPGALGQSAALDQSPTPEQSATLTLEVTGLKTTDGRVQIALFVNKADYDADKMETGISTVARMPGVAAAFPNLAPGEYALKVFHDRNGDGKLNTNLLGIPTEPFAFSNNAKGKFGPASWDDARFTVSLGANTHTITLE